MTAVDQRVPLRQTNLVGIPCGFEPNESGEEFSTCLPKPTRFSPAATQLNPATPWLLAVYAADLETYALVRQPKWQRAEGPREKVEPAFQNMMATSKDSEMRCGMEARGDLVAYLSGRVHVVGEIE